jgi:hypothetical protein
MLENIGDQTTRVSSDSFSSVLGDDFAVGFRKSEVPKAVKRLAFVAQHAPSTQMADEARTLVALLKTTPRMSRDAEVLGNGSFSALRIRRTVERRNDAAKVLGCDSLRLLTLLASFAMSRDFDLMHEQVQTFVRSGIPVCFKGSSNNALHIEIFGESLELVLA